MKPHALIVSVLLVATATARAQQATSPPPCPVGITHIDPEGGLSFGQIIRTSKADAQAKLGHIFVLKAKNTSGKDIKGMKFQASYLDATEDSTNIPIAWNWTDVLKMKDEKSFRWDNAWSDQASVGWTVRLMKVLYVDGSKWEPSEGQVCSGSYWKDKHHKA